jgi:Protein of unknown function (DUF998)
MESVAAALYCADLIFLISFQFLNRDYAMFSHAVSDYGIGKTAGLFKAYVLAGAIAAPLLGWQFWSARNPDYPAIIPGYLVLVMLGRMILGLFPNDLRGSPRTPSGQIHHFGTLLAFTCAYMTVAEATPLLAGAVTGPLATVLSGLKHVISFAFIGIVLTKSAPLRRFFGLAERIFLYCTALWFLTASLTLPPV